MKVFFTASHRGKKKFGAQYDKIYSLLKDLDFKHLSDTVVSLSSEKYYDILDVDGHEGYIKEYTRILSTIRDADIMVFESSYPSLGAGYMIQKSLQMNKPVIVLYLKGNIPTFLVGIQDEKFQLIEYTDSNLDNRIKEAIEKAKSLADKRFNFFISPTLLTYLNKASKEEGVTKSTFIRNLINDYKRKIKQ